MASVLSEDLLVPVTLAACMILLERFSKHRLYGFLCLQRTTWIMIPRYAVSGSLVGWNKEDVAQIDAWLGNEKGFRAFMLPSQRARFHKPIIDCENGKLVIRSGKKKVTPLE